MGKPAAGFGEHRQDAIAFDKGHHLGRQVRRRQDDHFFARADFFRVPGAEQVSHHDPGLGQILGVTTYAVSFEALKLLVKGIHQGLHGPLRIDAIFAQTFLYLTDRAGVIEDRQVHCEDASLLLAPAPEHNLSLPIE